MGSPASAADLYAVEMFVGNAKLSAAFFHDKLGFDLVGVQLLETGHLQRPRFLMRQAAIRVILTGSYDAADTEYHEFMRKHGDSIRDIQFVVDDVEAVCRACESQETSVLSRPEIVAKTPGASNSDATAVVRATVATPHGNIVHTLYSRSVLQLDNVPGFEAPTPAIVNTLFAERSGGVDDRKQRPHMFSRVDHAALAIPKDTCREVMSWYLSCFGFSRFICSGEDPEQGIVVHGKSSGLKSVVMTTQKSSPDRPPISEARANDEFMKIVLVEPDTGAGKSQIQEFLDFNGGTGVAHLAFHCDDILQSVAMLRDKGISFIDIPQTYYELQESKGIKNMIVQSWEEVVKQRVLVDCESFADSQQSGSTRVLQSGRLHYLLQVFTVPLQDRPTFYLELISRFGAAGFGKGNITALFEAMELQQARRGNLV